MQTMPDIVLKRKRLSKTKTVVIFCRNNLSFSNFRRMGTGYVFEESFTHHGIHGYIKLVITSENLYDMFSVNTKKMKLKGGKDHLGVFLRFGDQKQLPLSKKGSEGCIRYELTCEGKELYYDGIRKKTIPEVEIHNTGRRSGGVPTSVKWSVSHPLQGGGFSPK